MDSINKNQPENNHKDLSRTEAVKKIKELVEKAESCFFCTAVGIGESSGARPMSVQKVDEQGNLWFLSASDSHKNIQGSAHSDFLQLNGHASISTDKTKIKELWNPVLRTWFTEGEHDPRISVIKIAPLAGYYWDNKHGKAVAGIKMLIGAAIGKTLDDSIEGKLQV
jgi:general stress protein 26